MAEPVKVDVLLEQAKAALDRALSILDKAQAEVGGTGWLAIATVASALAEVETAEACLRRIVRTASDEIDRSDADASGRPFFQGVKLGED